MLSHLDQLEAESIFIIRECFSGFERPVILYSIGKDSSVLLHLARKAFAPLKLPVPLLHVDTTWKFREMIAFRDETARKHGLDLIVYTNAEALARGISPLTESADAYTYEMKTRPLLSALSDRRFDAAIGGARRDEEKSRAKERTFSFRNAAHRWDPRNQRPEPWSLFNLRKSEGESARVFPLSNWTELDIWQYIERESLPVVPLYFAQERPVLVRDGKLIVVDDERLQPLPGEKIFTKRVRFRTLGCYPLTSAIESTAATLSEVVREVMAARYSERAGRLIDLNGSHAMEKKKQEGYF